MFSLMRSKWKSLFIIISMIHEGLLSTQQLGMQLLCVVTHRKSVIFIKFALKFIESSSSMGNDCT